MKEKLTERGESAPKKAKTVPSAGKAKALTIASFFDAGGIVFIDYYLQEGKTKGVLIVAFK